MPVLCLDFTLPLVFEKEKVNGLNLTLPGLKMLL